MGRLSPLLPGSPYPTNCRIRCAAVPCMLAVAVSKTFVFLSHSKSSHNLLPLSVTAICWPSGRSLMSSTPGHLVPPSSCLTLSDPRGWPSYPLTSHLLDFLTSRPGMVPRLRPSRPLRGSHLGPCRPCPPPPRLAPALPPASPRAPTIPLSYLLPSLLMPLI